MWKEQLMAYFNVMKTRTTEIFRIAEVSTGQLPSSNEKQRFWVVILKTKVDSQIHLRQNGKPIYAH